MPIELCVKCQAQYLPKKTGVNVIETAGNPPVPMRTWVADLLGCPVCGAELISRFSHEPTMERHEHGFESHLKQVREKKDRLYILHNPEYLMTTIRHETKYVRSYANHKRLRTTDR
jgi:hypothetical protein